VRAFRLHPGVSLAKSLARLPGTALAHWQDAQASFQYELAICAIFKNEARFLDEWITFHSGVGVQHFYLYDNDSSDRPEVVLGDWVRRGVVTLMTWPGRARQPAAYNDCVARFRHKARWIAFIDIDEFLFSPVERDIKAVLADYRSQPAIFVYWHMFGSSGHVTRPDLPVIEAYTRRLDDPIAHKNGKTIVNPRLVRRMEVHWAKTWIGATLDENGRPPPHGPDKAMSVVSHRKLRINHYWSRSIEDLHDKVRRGDATFNVERNLDRHLETESTLNSVEDREIIPIWREINRHK
jgi:hypothetical protein